jgi:adenylosuccinate synthase
MADGVTIFEGAQGVLLDEDYGFAPYNTWSKTTPLNARSFTGDAVPTTVVGVTRTYLTRHGPGPLVTEDNSMVLPSTEHNRTNVWQRDFRRGWFDLPMFRYALARAGRVDTIALTHCDFRPGEFTYARGYRTKDNRVVTDLTPQTTAAELTGYTPLFTTMLDYEPAEAFQIVTGVKVGYVSNGPTEKDKAVAK